MVRGPMIAAVIAGWRRMNAMASSIRLIPACPASSANIMAPRHSLLTETPVRPQSPVLHRESSF